LVIDHSVPRDVDHGRLAECGVSYRARIQDSPVREVDLASSYRGIYVQRLSGGQIFSVQVQTPDGMSIPLAPGDYEARRVEPLMGELRDVEAYFAKRGKP
jgi:hypothetical protein